MSYEGYTPYPKALYHETEGTRIVKNEAEHDAIGDGWQESPFGPPETPDPAEAAGPEKVKRGRKSKADEPGE